MSNEILAQVIYKKNMDLVVAGKLEESNLFSNMNDHMNTLIAFIEEFTGSQNNMPINTTNSELVCPSCGNGNYFEDNRAKKATDVKFAKIPVFSCSNYKEKQGCGWKTWDEDILPSMEKGFTEVAPKAKQPANDLDAPF